MQAKVNINKRNFLIALLLTIAASTGLTKLFLFVPSSTTELPFSSAILVTNPNATSINSAGSTTLATPNKTEALKYNTSTTKQPKITDSQLNLKLVGVAESNDEHSARAIIAVGNKQDVYFPGSQLLSNEKIYLVKVMFDHVIINNNDHYERLWLYDLKAQNLIQELNTPSEANKDTPFFYSGPPNGYDDALAYHPKESDEEIALAEVNRNLANVVTMSIFRIESNKQVRGYKIQPGRDAAKFEEAGLQTNDMITAINGIPVTKPDEILESYRSMGATPITLELERGDNVIKLEINQTL